MAKDDFNDKAGSGDAYMPRWDELPQLQIVPVTPPRAEPGLKDIVNITGGITPCAFRKPLKPARPN